MNPPGRSKGEEHRSAPHAGTSASSTLPPSDAEHLATRLAELLAARPEGLGLEALSQAVGPELPRRTLQRRLAALVLAGRVAPEGSGRALRYRITAAIAAPPPPVRALPTSPEAEEIRAYVHRPLHERRPVSYDTRFLESYQPNRSAYLPEALRSQLQALGRSGREQAPAGTFARDMLARLLIDLSWASSRLEGNTYTRLDTERLIEFGQAAEGRDAFETQMILNHKAAIEYLVGDPAIDLRPEVITSLHALLSDGLLRDARAGGRVRQRAVEIGRSVYLPVALPQRLVELFGIVVAMGAEIADPFEQAFFLMVHLPYLQPFEDVNKRVSRLAANIPLMRHNLCPLSFIDVPTQDYIDGTLGVYELARVDLLRDVFIWAYERSCQQYVAVKQQLMPPDTFRLRYRAELTAAVRAIVQGRLSLAEKNLRAAVPASVAKAERARFVELMKQEFDTLHDGNAIRFGLRPLELAVWQKPATTRPRRG